MPRRSHPPARLRVVTPCTADWDSMVGNEQVRFCVHCNLEVHNLPALSGAEARRLVRKLEGRLCVRYYRPPADTAGATGAPPRLHQITRRASKLAAGAVGAVLTLGAAAAAQSGPRAGADAGVAVEFNARGGAALAGVVSDPAGAVITNAYVNAVNAETLETHTAFTNLEGVYRFESLPPGIYALTAAAPGFATSELGSLELARGDERRRDARLAAQGPDEVMEVTAGGTVVEVVMGGAMIVPPKDPLVKAAFDGDLKAVKELLAAGADVNVLDEDTETTALMAAVEGGHAEMVRALLAAGADVNLRNTSGRTPLMSLDADASADLARVLLAAGAIVGMADEFGNTALIVAAGRAKEEVLRVLLEAGADFNASNHDGRTALMWAAADGMLENVRALLAAGADLNRKDGEGATALSLAREGEHEEVVGLLVALGAEEEPAP